MENNNLVAKENDLGTLKLSEPIQDNTINFFTGDPEDPTLQLCGNGDIFVNGKKIENDIEVVEGMREFLTGQGLYKINEDVK